MIFSNGSTGKIEWSLSARTVANVRYRSWSFTSSDGDKTELLADVFGDGNVKIVTKLYEIDVDKPATLILKNVNESYNGTYQIGVITTAAETSTVVVYIAGKFHCGIKNCMYRHE